MQTQSICRRCHRIRIVDWARLCSACAKTLSEIGQRPSPPPPLEPSAEGEPETLVNPKREK